MVNRFSVVTFVLLAGLPASAGECSYFKLIPDFVAKVREVNQIFDPRSSTLDLMKSEELKYAGIESIYLISDLLDPSEVRRVIRERDWSMMERHVRNHYVRPSRR